MKGVMQMILHRKSMRLSVLILSILMMISMLMPSSAVFADDNAGGNVNDFTQEKYAIISFDFINFEC